MSAQSDRIIALSAVGTFGIGFLDSVINPVDGQEFPSVSHARLFVGAGIAFVGCAAIAEVSPSLGSAFAVLMVVTTIVSSGGRVAGSILKLTESV